MVGADIRKRALNYSCPDSLDFNFNCGIPERKALILARNLARPESGLLNCELIDHNLTALEATG